jgi:hypothetical protein
MRVLLFIFVFTNWVGAGFHSPEQRTLSFALLGVGLVIAIIQDVQQIRFWKRSIDRGRTSVRIVQRRLDDEDGR